MYTAGAMGPVKPVGITASSGGGIRRIYGIFHTVGEYLAVIQFKIVKSVHGNYYRGNGQIIAFFCPRIGPEGLQSVVNASSCKYLIHFIPVGLVV